MPIIYIFLIQKVKAPSLKLKLSLLGFLLLLFRLLIFWFGLVWFLWVFFFSLQNFRASDFISWSCPCKFVRSIRT